jgi:hypothetical protein
MVDFRMFQLLRVALRLVREEKKDCGCAARAR